VDFVNGITIQFMPNDTRVTARPAHPVAAAAHHRRRAVSYPSPIRSRESQDRTVDGRERKNPPAVGRRVFSLLRTIADEITNR